MLHVCIKFAHVAYSDYMVEVQVIGKCLIHFFLLDRLGGLRGVCRIERHQQEAFFIWQQVEYANVRCRGSEGAVVAVGYAVEGIIGCI